MKTFSAFSIVMAIALANAQADPMASSAAAIAASYPACANTCLLRGFQTAGCAVNDYKCHCAHVDGISGGLNACLPTTTPACTLDDSNKLKALIDQVCAMYPSVAIGGTAPAAASNGNLPIMTIPGNGTASAWNNGTVPTSTSASVPAGTGLGGGGATTTPGAGPSGTGVTPFEPGASGEAGRFARNWQGVLAAVALGFMGL
ncbi:hypothetical protein K402DRAFT_419461 [Aulographum hederae CBS 113979]|uniref:CFEM domain-containing protein n=1 Tax=Aulographum hederae CBS 113979 TaxID=1176131 RepID=A0A6G1H662_9PEZI|nr:hypothetical protein K402DRAFT_419461 [Aulographum hederae CBS 113979]